MSRYAGRNDPVLRLVAGFAAFQQGDFEAANMHLSIIAETLPDNHPGIKLLAASQLQLGLSDEATLSLQRLQTEDSSDAGLYSRAGYELVKVGNLADAEAMLERTQALGVTLTIYCVRACCNCRLIKSKELLTLSKQ